MLKITIQVEDQKDKHLCKVKLIHPKDLSKASDTEKSAGAIVINQIEKALKELEQ